MILCPLCHTILLDRMDDEFFNCHTCGGLVKHPALYPDQKTERNRYLQHNNDVDDPRYQRFTSPITNFIKAHYSSRHKGLDFGSGTGPVISKVLRDDGFDIKTYDPFFAPDEGVLQQRYDYIACCEVFEHFHHPQQEISRLNKMLKCGGRLIAMTLLYEDGIDFKNWVYRKDDTHVFIYRKESFEYIAATFGFSIEQMDERLIVLKHNF